MNKTSSLISLGLALFVLICFFFVLNIYSPLLYDDYFVRFKISLSPLHFTDEQVETFHDLFTNMWDHRYLLNGRMSNNLVMLLLYTVGKDGFNFLNSLVIILSLISLCKLALRKVTYRGIITSCALAILVIPCIPGTIFWLAGSCNYLWVTPFICGMLFYLEQYFNKQPLSPIQIALLIGCTFIASSMHEASGLILCGMLILSILFQYGRKEPMKLLWWVFLVSIIGTSIPLSAPGIWRRASGTTAEICLNIFSYILPFVSHCGLPLTLLSIYLYKKGWHSVLSPKGFYLMSGIACTLVFGSYGIWGGGYFYMDFSILIFILPGITSCLNKKGITILSASCLIILCTTIYQLSEFLKFDRILDEENKRAKNEQIFSIDVPLENYHTRYILGGTSCGRKTILSQKKYSIIKGVPEHQVIFNTIDFDKKIYSEFPNGQIEEPVVVKTSNLCMIRLPKGMEPIETSVNIGQSGKNRNLPVCLLFREYGLWDKIIVKRKPNRISSLYSIDYQKGFFYIVLPEPACHYHELTCSVTLPDESTQELHIDLDKTYQKP